MGLKDIFGTYNASKRVREGVRCTVPIYLIRIFYPLGIWINKVFLLSKKRSNVRSVSHDL